MLIRLIDFSVRRPGVVLLGALVIALVGLWSLLHLSIDAFPDTTPVQVQVNSSAPALAPLEIEQQITRPVEQAISGMPGLHEVRSTSRFGLSQVVVIFEDGADIYRVRQIVSERLATVQLPDGVRPELGPVSTGLGEIFHYTVEGPGHTLEELRTLHDWVIRPELRAVPGVAEVNAWGGFERQYQVVVDPNRLIRYNLGLDDVAKALEANNRNVGGGVMAAGGEARLVQGVSVLDGRPAVGEVVLASVDGVPVRVRDVAEARVGHALRHGAVTSDGQGETLLGLGFMLMGENSHAVARRLQARIDEIQPLLPAGVIITPVYDRTHLVDEVLHTVRKNLFEGALLVVAILFLLMGNLRAGLIVALAIPLSFLLASSLMLRFGVAASLMSLGAIDFGLVVDSSVILVENAARRLRSAPVDASVADVVRDAAVEVRRPTLFGELIILIVYLPVLTLEGMEGKLFRPMALTILFALVGSMVFSLTVMPALAALVLRRGGRGAPGGSGGRGAALDPGHEDDDTWLLRGVRRLYEPLLNGALRHGRVTLALAALLVALSAGVATRLGSEFIPRLSEMSIVINTVRATGISLEESVRYGGRIEKLLKEKFPDEIERIWTRTGTAEVATDAMGVENSDIFITLTPRSQWRRARTQPELVMAMEAEMSILPGMRSIFSQPIELRVNEMVAGSRSDVVLKLFGDDLDSLRIRADQLAEIIKTIPGAADVFVDQITGQPVQEFKVDREALGRYGVPADRVMQTVQARDGVPVGSVREGLRTFPLVVKLTPELGDNPAALAEAAVAVPGGGSVPFGRLVDVREYEGPATVTREWGRRRIAVSINVRGRDVGSFVAEAQRAVMAQPLPSGYGLRWGGQFEHLKAAQRRLMIVVPLALALILGLLYATYGRWRDAFRVFTGVPFAMVGGVLALWFRDLPFSVSAAIGFVALSGVSVLGDMVLVSFIRQRLAAGDRLDAAVRQAARTRLRPVLMTSLVAALGFLPMALNTGVGAEVQRPLASVVIGGLVSSTLLTLVVLPVLYTVVSRREAGEG